MQSSLSTGFLHRTLQHKSFEETELERRGIKLKLEAPVTGAIGLGDVVAVGFGDGTIRFFRPAIAHTTVEAHSGVVLCMATDGQNILTGGDDGKFLRISTDGQIKELADFGTQWVNCVAASPGKYACSSGKVAYVWSNEEKKSISFEHVSTVGGLAFDCKANRLAAAHYGGATVWESKKCKWTSSKLIWKGSHAAIAFSPDGKYVITAMQENALHGWRLRDKADLAMSGYPAKIKSFAWVGKTPYLVTAGADEAICWPFDGKDGPLGRNPICVAPSGKQIATCVQSLSSENAVFTGFQDGAVILAEIDESKEAISVRGSSGAAVTAIALTTSLSHILIGDESGQILWTTLWADT